MASGSTKLPVRRALLYVPASSLKMMDKTRQMKVDCVAYDLEDSVIPSKKVEARRNICGFFQKKRTEGVRENAVRINAVGSKFVEDDLMAVLKIPLLDTLIVPKVDSASDLHFVTDLMRNNRPLRHSESPGHHSSDPCPPIKILALIESAKALSNLPSICKASPYLSGLIFAAEDFALDLSLTRTPSLSEFLYARSAIVTESRANRLPSVIDLVCTSYKGTEGQRILEEECIGGKNLGFNGKQCIHPNQVETVQKAFAPGDQELACAVRIVVARRKAESQGRGAWTLDGKMIDAPVVAKAGRIVERARACGLDVEAVEKKWRDQEPE